VRGNTNNACVGDLRNWPQVYIPFAKLQTVLMLFKLLVLFFGAEVWAKKNEFVNWAACKFFYLCNLKSIWIVHKLTWQCSIGDVKSWRFGDVELIWHIGVVDVDLAVWWSGIHKQETSSLQYSKHHKNKIDKITKQRVFHRMGLFSVDRLVSEH